MLIRNLSFAAFLCLLLFAPQVSGQQQTAENQTAADENFKLNITDKKTVEKNYEAKVELKFQTPNLPQVAVNIGAAVRAEQITLTLKNVFGDVRFRGSLEKILNQIKLDRPPAKQ